MRVTAQKWGNSLAVRVPKGIAEEAGIRERDALDIELIDGRIVLTPRPREYRLEELVAGISDENRHPELDFGPRRGRERL